MRVVAALSASLVGVIFLYPLLHLLIFGLSQAPTEGFWSDLFLWQVVRLTYLQALLSTLLSAALGCWIALLYSERRFRGRTTLWRLSLVCFGLPSMPVILGFLGVWGKHGALPLFDSYYGWAPVLMVHCFFNFPLFLRGVGTALVEMDRSTEMAALSLGANRWQCFWRISWPKVRPAFLSAFALSFLYCSASFLVVLLLGGGPAFTTLEVAIYQAVKVELDFAAAARLALLQIIVGLALYSIFLWKPPRPLIRGRFVPLYPPRRSLWVLGPLFLLEVVVPLVSIAVTGLFAAVCLDWREVLPAVVNSFGLALAVAVLTVVLALGMAASETHLRKPWIARLFGILAGLPLSLSSMILTLALLTTYSGLRGGGRVSWLAVALIQTVLALPLAFRSVRDGWRRIPPPLYLSARSLGASPLEIFRRVEFPLLRRSLVLGALLTIGFSWGEVGSALVFLPSGESTLALQIYRWMAQYRFEEAAGLAVILVGGAAALFFWGGRWEEPGRAHE